MNTIVRNLVYTLLGKKIIDEEEKNENPERKSSNVSNHLIEVKETKKKYQRLSKIQSSKQTICNQKCLLADNFTLFTLLQNNQIWAESQPAGFFNDISETQTPEYLWIGCSDSRVPANEIVGLKPGEIFVHRNIANLVIQSDLNCLSALQFAVEHLKVKHVIVCGHYGCGGVKASFLEDTNLGLVSNWTRTILNNAYKYHDELNALNENDKINRLCELNVVHQVLNVCQSTILQDAWTRNQDVHVHGFIYNLKDGILLGLGVHIKSIKCLKLFRKDVTTKKFITKAQKLFYTEQEIENVERRVERNENLYYH